jgi:hypothetical protein
MPGDGVVHISAKRRNHMHACYMESRVADGCDTRRSVVAIFHLGSAVGSSITRIDGKSLEIAPRMVKPCTSTENTTTA